MWVNIGIQSPVWLHDNPTRGDPHAALIWDLPEEPQLGLRGKPFCVPLWATTAGAQGNQLSWRAEPKAFALDLRQTQTIFPTCYNGP